MKTLFLNYSLPSVLILRSSALISLIESCFLGSSSSSLVYFFSATFSLGGGVLILSLDTVDLGDASLLKSEVSVAN